jgi:beta-glucanase (GH16 family)
MLYGRIKSRFTSAGAPGIVTAFITFSDEKDEIDWEITGEDNFKVQTNFFYRGVIDYTKSVSFIYPDDTSTTFYDLEIIWTPNDITWLVNGEPRRRVTRAETCDSNNVCTFPETYSRIQIAVWDGSAGSEGTRSWAGGYVPWDRMPAGGFTATFQDMLIQWYVKAKTNLPILGWFCSIVCVAPVTSFLV